MRICSVDKLKPGVRLGKPVYDIKGVFLLAKDMELTEAMIKRLITNKIYFVYIEDEISEGISIESIIDDQTKATIITTMKDIMENKIDSKGCTGMIPREEFNKIKDIVDTLIEEIKSKSDISYMAVELMGTDMNTYSHSVNVAILSILNAVDHGYSMDMCEKIGIGAILHDIGKTKIDTSVLQKKEPFTIEEIMEMQRHSQYGYEMVRRDPSISAISKAIILNHHEKLDGTGYPNRIQARYIPDFVRIVTMADMFDAMTTDRVYRKRLPVHTALELLMTDCVSKIDSNVYKKFVKNVVLYPPGTIVELNEGTKGIVIKYDKGNPTRPLLRVFESDKFEYKSQIDLMNHLNLLIERTLD